MRFYEVFAVIFAAIQVVRASNLSVIDLGYARYVGSTNGIGVNEYLGIRYAAPPVGNNRFRGPQDPLFQDGVQFANKHGSVCISTPYAKNDTILQYSEDCLFMDIFAPSNSTNNPVFVFFQGGGFNTDANANYNGSSLIRASDYNIVVVNFNYRVGPWGFLASKEVQANGNINAGNLDQRKALQWVQQNIAKFGGDPGSVTIGGDSAGAASVTLHLTAYGGRDDGLFHAAAAESQSFGPQFTVEESQYQYDALVERVGCANAIDTLYCLRAVPIADLIAQNYNILTPGGGPQPPLFMYSNVIDGVFTVDYTHNLYTLGKFIKVPVIFGDDTNEGSIFAFTNISTYSEVNDFLKDQFPRLNDTELAIIDSLYPPAETFPNTSALYRTASNAYGEMRYNCPGIYVSTRFDEEGVVANWNYHYNVHDPIADASGKGVAHTEEQFYIWGQNQTGDYSAPASYYTPLNQNMGPIIQGYWSSFIRSHDPNKYRYPGSPVWERFNATCMGRLLLQTNATQMETVPDDQRERCDYLSSIAVTLQQ